MLPLSHRTALTPVPTQNPSRVSLPWRTATPHRGVPNPRRAGPHAQLVMRALDLFPGSQVLETLPGTRLQEPA